MRDEYAGYGEWKQWQHFGVLSSVDARYFRRELAGLLPLKGKRILEVGFGNGAFLSFARGQGAEVHGTEIIPGLISAARKAGFDAGTGKAYLGVKKHAGRFDAVLAFDVIEHMDKQELVGFFKAVHALLRPGGVFLVRFPNGDSPFGRHYQYGDITHKTVIGGRLIEHLAALCGYTVREVRNPRTQFLDNPLLRAVQVLQRGLRNLVEMGVGYTYFNRRLPLDLNLVAQLVKRPAPLRSSVRASRR